MGVVIKVGVVFTCGPLVTPLFEILRTGLITITDPANTEHQLLLVGSISTFITHDEVEA